MKAIISVSPAQTQQFASEFVSNFLQLTNCRLQITATIVGLYGDLGSGKTTFTQGVAKTLGIKTVLVSPTFVIQKIYKIKDNSNFKRLIHIDAYRIEDENELISLGWNNIISNPKNLILIEWAEKVRSVIPSNSIKIDFKTEAANEKLRKIVYHASARYNTKT